MQRSTRVLEPAGRLSKIPARARRGGEPFGLYVHVPFCETKCSYCSFHSIPSEGDLHEAFTRALCREIAEAPARLAADGVRALPPAETVFFGGGTPSLLTPDQLGRILEACGKTFRAAGGFGPAIPAVPERGDPRGRPERSGRAGTRPAPPPEITIECNPGTVDAEKLAALRAHGFNRVSFGAQSFDDAELRAIGRIHTARQIAEGVEAARAANFENVSLDLIFALPGQTMDRWLANVRAAVALGPEHLSCYMLQFDPGTPMTATMLRGALRPVDEELQREMLLATVDALTAAGFEPYEISNYARAGFACRHNLTYWTGAPYLGFGPSAHSFIPDPRPPNPDPRAGNSAPPCGTRWANLAGVEDYIRRVEAGEPLVGMREALTREQRMFETIFLGLRMTRGVDLRSIERRFGVPFDTPHGRVARRFVEDGFLEYADGRLRLTRRGLPVADAVMAAFG